MNFFRERSFIKFLLDTRVDGMKVSGAVYFLLVGRSKLGVDTIGAKSFVRPKPSIIIERRNCKN